MNYGTVLYRYTHDGDGYGGVSRPPPAKDGAATPRIMRALHDRFVVDARQLTLVSGAVGGWVGVQAYSQLPTTVIHVNKLANRTQAHNYCNMSSATCTPANLTCTTLSRR